MNFKVDLGISPSFENKDFANPTNSSKTKIRQNVPPNQKLDQPMVLDLANLAKLKKQVPVGPGNDPIYTGEFKDGKLVKGTIVYPNGIKEEGTFDNNKLFGQGTRICPDGEIEIGYFKAGQLDGKGIRGFADHSQVQEGIFKDGKLNGQGMITFADGKVFKGEFKDGELDGQATILYPNGDVLEGNFKDGKKNGIARRIFCDGRDAVVNYKEDKLDGSFKMTHPNGVIENSTFKEGVPNKINMTFKGKTKEVPTAERASWLAKKARKKTLTEERCTYEGKIKAVYDGKRLIGYGKKREEVYGITFRGIFKNNQLNGWGRKTYDGGEVHEGKFKNDDLKEGKIVLSDKTVLIGKFKDDELRGEGKKIYPDGVIEEGRYLRGKLNGQGKKTYPNGTIETAEYKRGVVIGTVTVTTPQDHEVSLDDLKAKLAEILSEQRQKSEQKTSSTAEIKKETIVDNYSGQRKILSASGKLRKGTFVNGQLVQGKIISYGQTRKGTFDENEELSGQGTMIDSDEFEEGFFKSGQLNGIGVRKFTDRSQVQEGMFFEGQLNGEGTITLADGTILKGIFKDGYLDGKGTKTYRDGVIEEGTYIEGELNGHAEKTHPNGIIEMAEYEKGIVRNKITLACPDGSVYKVDGDSELKKKLSEIENPEKGKEKTEAKTKTKKQNKNIKIEETKTEAEKGVEEVNRQEEIEIRQDGSPGANKNVKTIAERLEKNREYARIQQEKEQKPELPKYFEKNESKLIGEDTIIGRRKIGSVSCQGRRKEMEDTDLATEVQFKIKNVPHRAQVFGIFDGHGGAKASLFVKDNLVAYLKKSLEENNQNSLTEVGIFKALKMCFKNLDADFNEDAGAGTTATLAFILGDTLWVANVGDSRAILVKKDGSVVQASEDAKPEIERYKRKIESLGGFVDQGGFGGEKRGPLRVNAYIAVARAIGDKYLVSQKTGKAVMSPDPKITNYPLNDFKEGHLVLACDGLYEVSTTKEVGEAVKNMANKTTLGNMAMLLVQASIDLGSGDNISVMVIEL
jgi:serine/threonine protein phosphatase PrpC